VSSTDHKASRYAVFSTPSYLVPLRPVYLPQHPTLKHPQPMLFYQYQRPSFTPIQNKGRNYSSA